VRGVRGVRGLYGNPVGAFYPDSKLYDGKTEVGLGRSESFFLQLGSAGLICRAAVPVDPAGAVMNSGTVPGSAAAGREGAQGIST
jgi:hypothetical protein